MRVEQFILRDGAYADHHFAAFINLEVFNPNAEMRNVEERQSLHRRLRTPFRQAEPDTFRPASSLTFFFEPREPHQPGPNHAVYPGLRFGFADSDRQNHFAACLNDEPRIPACSQTRTGDADGRALNSGALEFVRDQARERFRVNFPSLAERHIFTLASFRTSIKPLGGITQCQYPPLAGHPARRHQPQFAAVNFISRPPPALRNAFIPPREDQFPPFDAELEIAARERRDLSLADEKTQFRAVNRRE